MVEILQKRSCIRVASYDLWPVKAVESQSCRTVANKTARPMYVLRTPVLTNTPNCPCPVTFNNPIFIHHFTTTLRCGLAEAVENHVLPFCSLKKLVPEMRSYFLAASSKNLL
jgi:hypothetical protein